MTTEVPVVLGEVTDAGAARRLAARLVVEGIGAQAEGSRVWVRPTDRADALVLARLFHEVDRGRSRVAPTPGAWWSKGVGRATRVAVTVALGLPVVIALVVAIQLR